MAAHHVVDHLVVPARVHVASHVVATAAVLAAGRAAGLTLDDVGLGPDHVGDGLRVGGAAAVVGLGAVAGAAAVPRTAGAFVDEEVAAASVGELVRRGLVDIPVGTAIYEEVVFRGVLQALADRHLSSPASTALVSAAFGLWHVLPAWRDARKRPATASAPTLAVVAATVGATAVAGLGFSALRRRTDSLVAPVVVHAAVNVAALAASGWHVRRRRDDAIGSLASPEHGPPGSAGEGS